MTAKTVVMYNSYSKGSCYVLLTNNQLFIYLEQSLLVLLKKIILIKNGLGNRPADAVATDLANCRVPGAKSCFAIGGER